MLLLLNHFSRVRLFVTTQTVACQAPLSVEFSRQEYWSGLPFSSPGDLSNPGIEPGSPALQADALPSELLGKHPGVTSDKLKLKDRLQSNGPDSFFKSNH